MVDVYSRTVRKERAGARERALAIGCMARRTNKVLLCRDDRFFPAEWLRKVVKDRLGITPDEIDGGHCVALSRPRELADRLDSYTS
jgi:hypothetical protein